MRLRDTVWGNQNPYNKAPHIPLDVQGWRTSHPILVEAAGKSKLMAEVGVWKGAGCIDMADANPSAEILAIDHFRGSSEHWLKGKWQNEVKNIDLYDLFLSNMRNAGISAQVTPLPLDSINAAHFCADKGLHFDLVHIDAGHEYYSVYVDLLHWAPLTKVIVMDDYGPDWPSVILATEDFLASDKGHNWELVEQLNGKALLKRK